MLNSEQAYVAALDVAGMKKTPDPVDKHVGARVRMRRMSLGLSQVELGEAIDLTFQQIQKYENATNRISASRLQQLALALHVSPAWFFEGGPSGTKRDSGPSEDQPTEILSIDEGLQLNRAFFAIRDAEVREGI